MLKREVFDQVGYFDESLNRFEDLNMWRRIAKKYEIFAIPQYACLLRTHLDNSLSNQSSEYIFQALGDYSNKVINEDDEFNLELKKSGLAKMYIYYGSSMMNISKFHYVGRKLFAIAYKFDPELRASRWTIARIIGMLYKCIAKVMSLLYKYTFLRLLDFQLYKNRSN